MWDDPTSGPPASKLDQFPLAGAYRAQDHHDSLSRERRLLIDPCSDRPERHITFDAAGNRAIARDPTAFGL